MLTKMKNIFGLLTLVLGVTILTSMFKGPSVSDYQIIEGEFKNLKVLPQNISKDSLMTLMQSYNQALGVKCNFCHSKDKAADDVHAKEVARHMITMTNEINVKNFDPIGASYQNAVTCAMCHRGTPKAITAVKYFNENMKRK
jgi:hypothetical protein